MKYILIVLAVWCAVNLCGVFTYANVTNGTCADKSGMCVNGSTLSLNVADINVADLNGKNFTLNSTNGINCSNSITNNNQINCTIMIDANNKVPVGLYDLTLVVNGSTNVSAGSILFGELNTNDHLSKWTPSLSTSKPYVTTGRDMGSTLALNTTFHIFGVFNHSENFSIVTFSYDSLNVSRHTVKLPDLTVQEVGDNYLTVKITGDASSFGMFGYVVKSTNKYDMYVPGVKRGDTFAVYMPIHVSAISGDCALNASTCSTSSKITFMSNTFNLHSPSYNVITIGTDQTTQNQIQCKVTEVTAESLTCTLSLKSKMFTGVYHMYIKTQVCPMNMISPEQHFADLILGKFNASSAVKGVQVANSTAAQYTVYDVMPRVIASKNTLKIHGFFDSSDEFDILILPQMIDWTTQSKYYPGCSFLASNSTTITCSYYVPSISYTITSTPFAMWTVMVRSKNTNYVTSWNTNGSVNVWSISSDSASFVARDSINPYFTGAVSDCARDSTKCVNNSILTLIGNSYAMESMTESKFLFPSNPNITCTKIKIASQEITCTLQLIGNATGIWKMNYHVKINNEWIEPAFDAGYLIVNLSPETRGWSATAEVEVINKRELVSNKAAFAAAIVMAVFAIVAILGLIIMCIVCKVVTKGEQEVQAHMFADSYNETSYRYRENDTNESEMQSYSKGNGHDSVNSSTVYQRGNKKQKSKYT